MRRSFHLLASVVLTMVLTAWPRSPAGAEDRPETTEKNASAENLKAIGAKIDAYVFVHHNFPPAYNVDGDGRKLLSWRVLILPYVDEKLYKQFHLDEPWDGEHNKKLIGKMPAVFARPGSKLAEQGKTNYLTLRGDKTLFPGQTGVPPGDVRGDMAATIMTVEVPDQRAVVWTKPDDFQYDAKDPAKGLAGLHAGGFLAGSADGTVHMIALSTEPKLLHDLFARNGGGPIDLDDIDPQRAAAKMLRGHKILVIEERDPNQPGPRAVTSVNFCGTSVFGDKKVPGVLLQQLECFPELQSLNLGDCKITSDQLKYLAGLDKLASLVLRNTAIDDKGLAHLRSLDALESLNLGETSISDAGLDHVATLGQLKVLDLSKTKVTDAGLKKLRRLSELKWLLLAETAITDAGLKNLAPLAGLGRLTINKTKVTTKGVNELKRAIPRLWIDYDHDGE